MANPQRERASIHRTILCATRFWAWHGDEGQRRGPTTPTLLQGVRGVVRKQGYSGPEVEKALRSLKSKGFVAIGGARSAKTIALTPKGGKVGCATVKLAPWTNDEYPGSDLRGASCGCSRK